MRNLVVCCDGTWNTPDQAKEGVPTPTNVVRLFNCLAGKDGKGKEQVKYYHPGVGTEGSWWEKVAGGAGGAGLGRNVQSAYKWLGVHYQPGDRIFLFGFSRGAYTVRSVAGMIATCGLLRLGDVPPDKVWDRVEKAYRIGYRRGEPRTKWAKGWEFHGGGTQKKVPLHFLGVWDTVGALGIPNDLALLNLLDSTEDYEFHDTRLSDSVVNARHAVAIDELRASFAPTLWSLKKGRAGVKQLWFPGVHSDVGGGYPETGLSDGALMWMIEEAKSCGLAFHKGMVGQIAPHPQGVLHDSRKGVFAIMRTLPRSMPFIDESNEGTLLHTSTLARHGNPPITQAPYHPGVVLGKGAKMALSIYADQPWNETGIYLEAGAKYSFSATGQWVDRTIKCGPGGASDGDFQAGEVFHLAGSLLGTLEGWFRRLTRNEEADLRGTKRIEELPWFMLVGSIANGGSPDVTGRARGHETIGIGEGCAYTVKRSGYLYCFANDAWGLYGNNRGAVSLTVERLT